MDNFCESRDKSKFGRNITEKLLVSCKLFLMQAPLISSGDLGEGSVDSKVR
jgi:hypothetical protein